MSRPRTPSTSHPSIEEMQRQNAELQQRLDESLDTLRAIREGAIDALVVGDRIYTLEGAERPYRLFVEEMQQAVATLTDDATIVYCNRQFADLVRIPHERIIGMNLAVLTAEENRESCLLKSGRLEARILRSDGERVPVIFAFNPLLDDQ